MARNEGLSELKARLLEAWSPESSSLWRADNPAFGQCNPTALVVQEVLGGELLKTPASESFHFYNRVDGERFDLTALQFARPLDYQDIPASREEAMAGTSPAQCAALRKRLGIV